MKTYQICLLLLLTLTSCKSDDCIKLSKEDYQLNAQAENEFKTGNIQQAIELSSSSILKNPQNYIAYSNRGAFNFNKSLKHNSLSTEEKERIFSDLYKAIQLCPQFSKGHRNLIKIAYEFKAFDIVIVEVNKYNQRFEKSSELLTRLGDALYEKREYTKAIEVLDEAVSIKPTFDFAYVIRGKCHSKQKNYDRAIADLNYAIDKNQMFSLAFHERAYCFSEKQQLKKAKADYLTAIEIDSNRYESYFGLGTLAIENGDTLNGCEYYTIAQRKFNTENSLVKYERWNKILEETILDFCTIK